MLIRNMIAGDADPVHRLLCASMDEYFAPEVITYFLYQWPNGQLVSTDPIGRINGYIAGSRLSEGKVSVALFAVRSDCRDIGIGSALLSCYRQRALMEGARSIQLEVRVTNMNAIRFYEKRGFMRTEILPHFYNDGGDAVRMIAPVMPNM